MDWLKKDLIEHLHARFRRIEEHYNLEDVASSFFDWMYKQGPPPTSMQMKDLLHENEVCKILLERFVNACIELPDLRAHGDVADLAEAALRIVNNESLEGL